MNDEAELVENWNRSRFRESGFSDTQVEILVAWGISAHDVESLLRAGCPRHLIMRIVRPLDVLEEPVPLEAVS